jgi:large subunit ribosomal protein L10
MNRQQKEAVITDIRRMMTEAQATFLVNYKGMPVSLLQDLRKKLRSEGSKLKVSKATLMRRAAQELDGTDTFADTFKDQVGLVFVQNNVSGTAKQLVNFAKEHEMLKVIAGFYEAKMLSKQELDFIATLPPREVLIGQLLGTMQAPITGFVRVLHAMIARLVYVLAEIERKQQEK